MGGSAPHVPPSCRRVRRRLTDASAPASLLKHAIGPPCPASMVLWKRMRRLRALFDDFRDQTMPLRCRVSLARHEERKTPTCAESGIEVTELDSLEREEQSLVGIVSFLESPRRGQEHDHEASAALSGHTRGFPHE